MLSSASQVDFQSYNLRNSWSLPTLGPPSASQLPNQVEGCREGGCSQLMLETQSQAAGVSSQTSGAAASLPSWPLQAVRSHTIPQLLQGKLSGSLPLQLPIHTGEQFPICHMLLSRATLPERQTASCHGGAGEALRRPSPPPNPPVLPTEGRWPVRQPRQLLPK